MGVPRPGPGNRSPERLLLSPVTAVGLLATLAAGVTLIGGTVRLASATPQVDVAVPPSPSLLQTPVPAPPRLPAPRSPAPTAAAVAVRAAATPVARTAAARPPARPAVARPATPPAPPRNLLVSGDGTLRTGVGVYTDCSGQAPVPRYEAVIDTCVHDVTYFAGHNPGVFTPLMHMAVGATVTWWDGSGHAQTLRIVAERNSPRSAGQPGPVEPDVTVQFQTCVTLDGSIDRIFDLVRIA